MHYLIRMEPFTTLHIQLQSGKFVYKHSFVFGKEFDLDLILLIDNFIHFNHHGRISWIHPMMEKN